MGKTHKCKYCGKPIPVDQKEDDFYLYDHFDFDKGQPCPGSGKRV
jgi:hypothetical protein